MRGYIYLVSFKDTNDIYIGKTRKDIWDRLYRHYTSKASCVYKYIQKFNINYEDIYIDIIDSIDMTENLSRLYNKELYGYKFDKNGLESLINLKLSALELFHIQNYINEGKYNLINIYVSNEKNNYLNYDIFFKNKTLKK